MEKTSKNVNLKFNNFNILVQIALCQVSHTVLLNKHVNFTRLKMTRKTLLTTKDLAKINELFGKFLSRGAIANRIKRCRRLRVSICERRNIGSILTVPEIIIKKFVSNKICYKKRMHIYLH